MGCAVANRPVLIILVLMLLFCTACSGQEKENKEDDLLLPGGPAQSSTGNEQQPEKPSGETQTKSTIYPPSIFVIEARLPGRKKLPR